MFFLSVCLCVFVFVCVSINGASFLPGAEALTGVLRTWTGVYVCVCVCVRYMYILLDSVPTDIQACQNVNSIRFGILS